MTTAELFVEALTTATTLVTVAWRWCEFLLAIGSILTLAAVACGVWGWMPVTGAQDGAEGDVEASGGTPEPDEAPEPAGKRQRAPAWACQQPANYDDIEIEEAA